MGFVPKLIFLWFYDFCENAKLHSSSWPGLGIQINCSWTGPRSGNLLHVRSGSGPQFGSGSGSEPFYAVELSILNNFEIYSFKQVFHLKNILFKNYTKSMALFSLFNLCGSGSVFWILSRNRIHKIAENEYNYCKVSSFREYIFF